MAKLSGEVLLSFLMTYNWETESENLEIKNILEPGTVVHSCNPNYFWKTEAREL